MLSIDGVSLESLHDATCRGPDKWFLLHHKHSNHWVSVRTQEAVWKEMTSREYDDWRGPFDSVEIVRRENVKANEIKSSAVPAIQDQYLWEQVQKVKERFNLPSIRV